MPHDMNGAEGPQIVNPAGEPVKAPKSFKLEPLAEFPRLGNATRAIAITDDGTQICVVEYSPEGPPEETMRVIVGPITLQDGLGLAQGCVMGRADDKPELIPPSALAKIGMFAIAYYCLFNKATQKLIELKAPSEHTVEKVDDKQQSVEK